MPEPERVLPVGEALLASKDRHSRCELPATPIGIGSQKAMSALPPIADILGRVALPDLFPGLKSPSRPLKFANATPLQHYSQNFCSFLNLPLGSAVAWFGGRNEMAFAVRGW